jgi:subtilisin family serine protease
VALSYGNLTDVTAPGDSRFQTPTLDPVGGRVLSTYSHTANDLFSFEIPAGRAVQARCGEYYVGANGTSMASPHAAGVATLIRAAHPGWSTGAVVAMPRRTATGQACPAALDPGVAFFGAPGSNNFYGKGLINALLAARG